MLSLPIQINVNWYIKSVCSSDPEPAQITPVRVNANVVEDAARMLKELQSTSGQKEGNSSPRSITKI